MSVENPVILQQRDGLGAALCGPVFINIFYGPPTVERLEMLRAIQRRVMTNGKFVVVSLVDPGVGREMTRDARKRASEIGKEMEPFTLSHALIVLGDGFFASMVRSIVAGVQLVSGPKHSWKVFGDVDTGLIWALAELAGAGKTGSLDDLRDAARTLLDGRDAPATASPESRAKRAS